MKAIHQYGYYKIAAAVPAIKVADVSHNSQEILRLIRRAAAEKVSLLAFPELCLTGSTCGDLFLQSALHRACKEAILSLAAETEDCSFPIVIGSPVVFQSRVFNCAVVLFRGRIKGIVAKQSLTPEESRYFTSAILPEWDFIDYQLDELTYFDNYLSFFHEESDFSFTIELGEDHWHPLSPSALNRLQSVKVIVNPSALPAGVGALSKTEHNLKALSVRSQSAYLHVNAGYGESTTANVYDGHVMIFENGRLLVKNESFRQESQLITAIIDLEKLSADKAATDLGIPYPTEESPFRKMLSRRGRLWYSDHDRSAPSEQGMDENTDRPKAPKVPEANADGNDQPLLPVLPKFPFIPDDPYALEQNCREIIDIVVSGLIKRIRHIGAKSSVIGISGGLDSTLALLLVARAYQAMGKDRKEIIGVRMPGFGTSGQTYQNSVDFMRLMKISEREVDIKASVIQHLNDIDHPLDTHDTTYENAQARERTQILMDIANQTGGLVIGTGDLSELALGFCTYNGDHMSMYSVNASIPKTLIPYVIRSLGREHSDPELIKVLEKIIDTPISPELLPPTANQKILQKTEELIGPYALHDFFLYYMLRYGFAPSKIRALAVEAFAGDFSYEAIDKWLKVFYRRFFQHQFKRNCLPDSPVLGSISVFGSFRMPSDAAVSLWLSDLEKE